VIRVRRAGQRYETRHPGIVTRSCFASGAHYEPDNVAFGPLVAVDEHLIDPAAGFPEHPHRGVDLVTVVLSGRLRHEDGTASRVLPAGAVHVQHAGGGIRHAELNASDVEPLRIVQMAVLADDDRTDSAVVTVPVRLPAGVFDLSSAPAELEPALHHLFVLDGSVRLDRLELAAGDTVRADERLRLGGSGRAVRWTFSAVD
jgi:quercetin dioxygenase-like cupin family protein